MAPLDLHALPKTELHLHLEGAIPIETLLELIRKYDRVAPGLTLEQLRERLIYRDFPHFLDTWRWMAAHVREYEDFTRVARDVARELARQHVLYAELFISPPDFLHHQLHLQEIAQAVRRGLDAVPDAPDIRLIVDLCRRYGPELGARWLEETAEVADEAGIVGIGLGGPEHTAPPEPYADVFRRAASLGLRRVAHAGEVAPPASIWGAIRALGAERIGHGTTAVQDADLVAYLSKTGLPVEVCVTSNVCTGVVARAEEHPVRRLFDAGVRLTLASDDPTFFNATLADEYGLLRTALGFTDQELLQIARTGIEVTFAPPEQRRQLLARFDAFADSLGVPGDANHASPSTTHAS